MLCRVQFPACHVLDLKVEKGVRMKIFENDKSEWRKKINFVDDNNILVGFDMSAGCCENFGWFISKEKQKDIVEHKNVDVENFNFDLHFFEKIEDEKQFEEGGMVIFRLVNGEDQLFLHLYNCQNGYYSHGFTLKKDEVIIHEGEI